MILPYLNTPNDLPLGFNNSKVVGDFKITKKLLGLL
jgi:hypothetical protein